MTWSRHSRLSVPMTRSAMALAFGALEDEISAGADRCEECCDKQTDRAQTSLSWLADTLLSQHRTVRIKFCRPTGRRHPTAVARSRGFDPSGSSQPLSHGRAGKRHSIVASAVGSGHPHSTISSSTVRRTRICCRPVNPRTELRRPIRLHPTRDGDGRAARSRPPRGRLRLRHGAET